MFSTDKPITDASEDKLGRSGFAERLAKAIINFDTADRQYEMTPSLVKRGFTCHT